MKKTSWVAMAAVMAAAHAYAAGIAIYEVSARGNALGGALVGSTGDASANYYNPANLTELEGTQMLMGITALCIVTDATVNGARQEKMNSGWYPPSHFYLSHQLSDDLYLGFGIYTEFGLGTNFNRGWALRAAHTFAEIEAFTFAPALAYKITDNLSIGASLRMMYLTFNTRKRPDLTFPGSEFDAEVDGESFGVGGKFGITYRITDDLSAGLTYTTRIRHNLDGDATFREGIPAIGIPPYSSDSHANVNLPSALNLGLNYNITDKWRAGVVAIWTEWSTLQELAFQFNNNPTFIPTLSGSTLDLRWKDVYRFGIGTEYDVTENWTLMAGYNYDFDPSQNNPKVETAAMLPPGDRHVANIGTALTFGRWTATVGYSLIINHAESATSGGNTLSYNNGFAHSASFALGVKF